MNFKFKQKKLTIIASEIDWAVHKLYNELNKQNK